MARPKGQPKIGGRAKGTPNKTTTDVREAIARIAQESVEDVRRWLGEIEDPAKKVSLFLDLCEYHIPKLARTELAGDKDAPITVEIVKFARQNPEQLGAKELSVTLVGELRGGMQARD